MINYYIYYSINADQAEGAERQVRLAIEQIRKETHISGRLLKNAEEPTHWMEVYEHIADPEVFLEGVDDAVRRFGLANFLLIGTARRVECFGD
jgi:hypothetical protein